MLPRLGEGKVEVQVIPHRRVESLARGAVD